MRNQFKTSINHTNPRRIISKSKSQAAQDLFVVVMSDAKQNGTFLEIGAGHPLASSNTYLLEHELGWSGHSIDIHDIGKTEKLEQIAWTTFYNNVKADQWPESPQNINDLPEEIRQECLEVHNYDYWIGPIIGADAGWDKVRPNTQFHQVNALEFDYSTIPSIYDYLQIDIDPPINNLVVLEKIINNISASIITFEHDAWNKTTESMEVRIQSRQLLKQKGYELLINDICVHPQWFIGANINMTTLDPIFFEDWWVNPAIISTTIRDQYRWITDSIFLKTADLVLFKY